MQKQFDSDWFSYNIPSWETHLSHLKNKPNITGLEIGVYQGRSTCWLLDNIFTHPSARLVAVDPFTGNEENKNMPEINTLYQTFLQNTGEYGPRTICYKSKSRDFFKLNELQFDFIYIDGDHHSYACLEDGVRAWEFLKQGGIMIFDDYGGGTAEERGQNSNRIPFPGISAFMICYGDLIDIVSVNYQVIIRKK